MKLYDLKRCQLIYFPRIYYDLFVELTWTDIILWEASSRSIGPEIFAALHTTWKRESEETEEEGRDGVSIQISEIRTISASSYLNFLDPDLGMKHHELTS